MRIAGLHIDLAAAIAAACIWLLPVSAAAAPPDDLMSPVVPDLRVSSEAKPGESQWDLQDRLKQIVDERQQNESRAQARATSNQRKPAPEPDPAEPSALDDPDVRRERIERHLPSGADAGLLPTSLVRQTSRRWGAVLAWFADYEQARDAYSRAVALGANDPETLRALGRMRARTGDFDGAEAALLSGLELSAVTEDRALAFSELGAVYLGMQKPYEARDALERGLELSPDSLRLLELNARARFEIAPHWEPPPPRPVILWQETGADRRREGWESTLASTHAMLPLELQRLTTRFALHLVGENGRLIALGILAGLFLLWLGVRRLKGKGDLAVTLAYPAELAGTFSVRLATTPGKYKRQPRSAKAAASSGPTRASTRTEHFAISRETKFQGLRTGLYYVTAEGILQDPGSTELVTDPFDEQAVQVLSKQTVHIDFEVAPRESLVDVRVSWNKQPAKDAAVAARGLPQSLRYARDGSTRLRLRKGKHVIIVGSGDRVAECAVELDSFRAASVDLDLGSSENLIFKGCPPAVEPYLHGDLSAASRALERDGHHDLANLLLARLHQENGRTERAADHYQRARHWEEAAELRAELEQWEEAAQLFQQAESLGRAGEMLSKAGDLLRAGKCFEGISDYENAIECYKEAGEIGMWVDALEKDGSVFDAAKLAVEHRDQSRAIRLLQQIQPEHEHHLEACEMLASCYKQEGHRDLAAQKLEERIGAGEPEETPTDVHSELASLWEQEGEVDKALEVLSGLREIEPTYPNIATRIEELRKKQSERDLSETRAVSKPTAFLGENRYEIQGEIGRGGMGVVLKARDTRLQRTVALKRLPETLRDHPKAIQLFLREAQSAARLNHTNIVTVYDTDQEDGNFFITMELLEGSPISKILKKRGSVSPKNAAQLGVQIATGLEYAHQKGIVHRDIKSANLFFTLDKVVKIMDFGLAKMMEEVRRGTTVIGGTPYYMAPEQAAGDTVDARADIYALGVTLFEFVTGKVPFADGDVTYQHRHAAVPDPRTLAEGVPDAMAELILEMMAKLPEDRVSSAAEVGQRLSLLIS
jgi:tetratricopeptide (TPR) repeat protein